MPSLATSSFGRLHYDERQLVTFPRGLPAFEQETRFLVHEPPETSPVVFLQSFQRPDLVFMTLPTTLVMPDYQLLLSEEDLDALGLDPGRQLEQGREVLCLSILTASAGHRITANLMAPIVVRLATRQAIQAIRPDGAYPHQFPLVNPLEESPCS